MRFLNKLHMDFKISSNSNKTLNLSLLFAQFISTPSKVEIYYVEIFLFYIIKVFAPGAVAIFEKRIELTGFVQCTPK